MGKFDRLKIGDRVEVDRRLSRMRFSGKRGTIIAVLLEATADMGPLCRVELDHQVGKSELIHHSMLIKLNTLDLLSEI